jgi:uncharacterized protein YyaL (SSP411 family)
VRAALNRLARESSPYLRQHQHNPVDWYPWGPEALARASAEDRPIFLSIGYAACHWCHVMERESFEDAETAAKMNALFVNIKVDREERPDIDNIYQTAVQLTRKGGGWPLSAFLFPDGRPFFLGTYFPPEARWGMPSFRQVLDGVARAWIERRADLVRTGAALVDGVAKVQAGGERAELPARGVIAEAAAFLAAKVDPVHGGFGEAPKFPSPSNLWVLWRRRGEPACRDALLLTLRKMAAGGIYDHLGGGFHRYSTDAEWLVPHFEKMLYDNAQLARLYLSAWKETREAGFLRVASETLEWILRDMTSPDGLFYGTADADSEGEEGRYFVWTLRGVRAVAGEDADAFARVHDVTEEGNWEGRCILRRRDADPLDPAAERAKARLLAARGNRVAPLRDEKVLASWNGLTIHALVDAWDATGDDRWLAAAVRAGEALATRLVRDGALQHSICGDDVRGPGLLDDHAAVGLAWLRLFESTGERPWLSRALAVATELVYRFGDDEGGWWQTPADGEALVQRPRDRHDSAVPSGSALAADFFHRLHVFAPEERWSVAAEGSLRSLADLLGGHPFAAGHGLGVLDAW